MSELRKRGLITAVIYSGPFLKLAKNQARTFGVPDLPLLEITHPLGGIALDDIKTRAGQVIPQFADLVRKHIK